MSGYPAMFEHSARLGTVVSTWLFYLLSVSQTACSLESAPAAAPPRLAPQASVLTAAALLLVAAWQPRIARTAATVRYRSDAQGTCTLNNFTKSPARARPALLEHFTESKSHVGLPCHVRAQRSAWHGSLDMAFLFALRIADGLFP